MKRLLPLFTFLLFSLLTIAQPTLSDSWIPSPGDSWELMFVQDSINAGPAGANVTWDFSDQDPNDFDGSFEVDWINPSMGTYSDSFPSATVASTSTFFGFTNEAYYEETATSFNVLGSASSTITSIYTDPQELRYIDLQFGEMQSDDYALTTYGFGDPGMSTGAVTWHYDAYGTLILPNNSVVNDAIRLAQEDIQVDSSAGAFAFVVITRLSGYSWIGPGAVLPVAQIQRSQTTTRTYANGVLISEETDPPEFTFSFSPDIVSTSTEDLNPTNELKVFPTLTSSKVNVQIEELSGETSYVLHNLTGQPVNTGYFTRGNNTIDLTGIPNGYYLLNVEGFTPERICKIK